MKTPDASVRERALFENHNLPSIKYYNSKRQALGDIESRAHDTMLIDDRIIVYFSLTAKFIFPVFDEEPYGTNK